MNTKWEKRYVTLNTRNDIHLQVFNNYFVRSDAELLRNYGFISFDTSYTKIPLPLSLPKSDPNYKKKMELLKEKNLYSIYPYNENEQYLDNFGFSASATQLLKVVYSPSTERKQMRKLLTFLMDQYPTSLEEDEAMLANVPFKQGHTRKHTAVKLRASEKRLILAAINKLS